MVACWPSVAPLYDCLRSECLPLFLSMGDRFLSSGMSLWCMRRPCAYVVFSLYLRLCLRGVAWRGLLVAYRFSWFPSLPQLSWFRVSPSFPLFFSRCFGGLFILLPLGFWPQCDGCYSGGLGAGGLVARFGLVDLWVFFSLGV